MVLPGLERYIDIATLTFIVFMPQFHIRVILKVDI